MTTKKLRIHREGNLQLPSKKLNYRCAPQWRNNTKTQITRDDHHDAANRGWTAPADWDITKDKLLCPKCKTPRPVRGSKLRNKVGFEYLACNKCKLATRAKMWECQCNTLWHACDIHSIMLPQLGDAQRRHTTYIKHEIRNKKRKLCHKQRPNTDNTQRAQTTTQRTATHIRH